jgi:type I restriction enzyme S subunit
MIGELPEGWDTATIAELASKVGSGATPRGGSESYKQSGVPLIRSQNVHFDGFRDDGLVFLDGAQADALKEVAVEAGDVLLNITGASIGRVTRVPERMQGARVNQHVCIIRIAKLICGGWLAHYLSSPGVQQMVMTAEYGVTRQALTKGQVLAFDIPIAPQKEQERIVAKVEALLARVNAARQRLAQVPAILKRFRQSVLAAACSGRLTTDWREAECSPREGAHAALARLEQLRQKAWKDTAHSTRRYRPASDPTPWPEIDIPEKWAWTTVSQVARLDVGFAFKSKEYSDHGVRLLRGENIVPGSLRWRDVRYWPKHRLNGFENLLIEPGEIILALDRPLISTGLKLARARAEDLPCLLVQRMMRFKVYDATRTPYLYVCLLSQCFVDALQRSTTGSDLPHITGTGVAEFSFPFPPPEEQLEIVRRVEALFRLADAIEKRLAAATAQAEKLTQAILAKAFRGELVPTEAELARREGRDYEPASELLARIRAERQGKSAAVTKRKTPRPARTVR